MNVLTDSSNFNKKKILKLKRNVMRILMIYFQRLKLKK